MKHLIALTCMALLGAFTAAGAHAQENLLANPGLETLAPDGFPADWGRGEFGKVGKTLFLDAEGAHAGRNCLRLAGTPNSFTTCAGKAIPVKPESTYWITWWFKAKQPETSRTYLFLQTNLAQRVFPHTDRRGDLDWELHIVAYRTRPGETSLQPVLTMHTSQNDVGTSWWDDLGVWEKLPPDLEALYRKAHPWDDVSVATARRLARTDSCVVWGDRAEERIYPQMPVPADAPAADAVTLTAPGRGHDVYQIVVSPTAEMQPVSLRFTGETLGLSYRVARCVPVKEVRDKSFPLGPTPDPLVEPKEPEPARPGQSALFWIEWAPPAGGKAGTYAAKVEVLSGGKLIASLPLKLRRWGFDLPEVPLYRSMVMVGLNDLCRLSGRPAEEAYPLAWDALAQNRLSGFNIALWPQVSLKDGQLAVDWARFDRSVEAAKRHKATAITLGPMFGGGCSQGWLPSKFVGLTPLADPAFDALYVDLNRQMAARLRAAGLLDRAYVYPYDEPEPDYMDKVARLCDLVHQGDTELKCLMTVDPGSARPLWGKVNAWIMPSSGGNPAVVAARRAAGDEIWVYNMVASIEDTPLSHRLYMWRALAADARGGLLWNCTWWNQINPWENPTAAPVKVGRNWESLYRYQAGQASLFYPDPAGKGPLVPALRLPVIRQGVEDFDIVALLAEAWKAQLPRLDRQAGRQDAVAAARAALIAPVVLDVATVTLCAARAEAMRQIAGSMLEVAKQAPAVIAAPTRSGARLVAAGWAEKGTRLMVNGKPVAVDARGRFEHAVTPEELAAGLRWSATKGPAKKTWEWAGLR